MKVGYDFQYHSETWERGFKGIKISKMSWGGNGPRPSWELAPSVLVVSFRSALVKGFQHYCFVYFRNLKIVQKRPEKNILKTEHSENDGVVIVMWFPWTSFLFKRKSKMTGDCCVFKFLRRSVDGKHVRFQNEAFVFKVLRRSVDVALVSLLPNFE